MRNSIAINQFVAVLIDADGAPFTDDILRSLRGGEMAASCLQREIKTYIEGISENSLANCFIWVQIFADVNGLSRKYLWDECNRNTNSATRLVQEFNSTVPLFNFVDVGEGKERVDNRIRGNVPRRCPQRSTLS